MNDVVILSACRTPIGKFQGALARWTAVELGAFAIRAAVERAGIPGDLIDEVIMGNVIAAGVGQAPARQAALRAGLPPSVAALTINKVCGSGLKAIALAAQAIRCGDAEVVVAGGMESMSRAPYLLDRNGPRLGDRRLDDSMLRDGLACPFSGQTMGHIAEALAASDKITRREQDEYATESHRRAIAAVEQDAFAQELIPVVDPSGKSLVVRDEGPRAETTIEQLAKLQPVFESSGVVTAGNSSMISDGAAAVVIASDRFAKAHGCQPLARVGDSVTAGLPPTDLFIAPVLAIQRLLERAGMKTSDIDLYELNEAFAVQMLACLRRLDLDADRVNIHGGAIALGHPIGASGARIVVSLLHALRRHRQKHGIAALCLGGGNAIAAHFELT
ncbi:MAG: thiolase family protein [Planctomycetota bacterium]|nr:thiolase family protein [Planctomycetota bacterium]